MSHRLFATAAIIALITQYSAFAQTLAPEDFERLVAQMRDDLANLTQGTQANSENRFGADALIRIIQEETKPEGNRLLRSRAISRLGRYPQSSAAIDTLIALIDEGGHKQGTWPLESYSAARALLEMGTHARKAILRLLSEPVPEHKLHLLAHVLLELDADDDSGLDPQITAFRLMREMEQVKMHEVAAENEPYKKQKLENLRSMIVLMLEPGFVARRIPPKPKTTTSPSPDSPATK